MMQLVSSDYLTAHGIPWCFREESYKTAQGGRAFVINLDDKENKGTHWTAARAVGDTLYYADPFGSSMNGWPPEELGRHYPKHVVNSMTFQRPISNLCGYYSIMFARVMDEIDQPLAQKELERALYYSITGNV